MKLHEKSKQNSVEEDERIDAWLWLRLRQHGANLPSDEFGGYFFRERMVKSNPYYIKDLIENEIQKYLMPNELLKWIGEDERQIKWILNYVENNLKCLANPCPPALFGRALVVASLDAWGCPLDGKILHVKKMQDDWYEYLKKNDFLKWFTGKEEVARCQYAWDWLVSRRKYDHAGRPPFSDYKGLLAFFDDLGVSEAQKKLDVAAIKSRWSQKKLREKKTDESQCNFWLPNKVIADLDKLAELYGVKRPQIIEALIKFEVNEGTYLSDRMKKPSWAN